MEIMDKVYNAQVTEDQIYKKWEASGAFQPKDDPRAKPFTIIMPPPNANDPLHIGHAMFVTIEDILIRYHRMKGDAALWLPGADHAGIETQFVFEKKLKKEGKSRFDFDRQTLFQMIWDYVQENAGVARDQMKKIGASADWSRFTFTLDPKVVELVLDTFFELHKREMIYRDLRLVNYCTRCGTGYSELEVKHVEQKDPLYYMKYGPFTLATVRPETKFGDTAVAVNPKDKRYQQWIGKEIKVEGLLGTFTMKVIADEAIDPSFGTGVAKVTPLHDFTDFEIWQRHKHELPEPKQIIDYNGKLQKDLGPYSGLSINDARKKVVEDLISRGLIEKIDENYVHTVGTCYRCGRVLEPLPRPQFFLKVKPMTEKVLKALKDKKVKIYGPGYDKILIHWLKNLKDWNISRQIVWGIRIPVWYDIEGHDTHITASFIDEEKKMHQGTLAQLLEKFTLSQIKNGLQQVYAMETVPYIVSIEEPKDGKIYIPETDTFDTWFSSGQWPVVTLKVNKPGDFERFYPTQVMETAYDILIFWVMRMLMLGIEMTGEVPFEKVYLHGLVRDEKGQKMSKSKGNVMNPIAVIEKYGADTLRMALVMSTTAGKDSNTGEDKIRGMRNFTNKIWNAARFVIMKQEESRHPDENRDPSTATSTPIMDSGLRRNDKNGDMEFKKHIDDVIKTVTNQLDNLQVGLAAETIYNEFWHYYCDIAIEKSKTGEISLEALTEGLKTFLILLHPFVPFVTEEIWGKLPNIHEELLLTTEWPKN